MENAFWGFDVLPKEIKQRIFSFTDLDLATVLRLQSTSSEFKRLCWFWMRNYDTSFMTQSERTAQIASHLINRVNSNMIRRMDLSRCEKAVSLACKILKKFPNLQRIEFGFQGGGGIEDKITEFEQHPELCEISLSLDHWYWPKSKIRFNIKLDKCLDYLRDDDIDPANPTINYSLEKSPFVQQEPIYYNRAYHRGGIIGKNMIVIGATDGTLTFLTLDAVNNRLVRRSTNTQVHKDCINAIWCEKENPWSHAPFITYIASNDRIVSSWSCVNDEPVLNQTIVFPESILFVCDHADKYVLAAGKRMLYIADTKKNMIVKHDAVDEDITGLHVNTKTAVLSTHTTIYDILLENIPKRGRLLQKHSEANAPNLWILRGSKLRISVLQNRITLFDHEAKIELFSNKSNNCTFDTRSHLFRHSPKNFWNTVSTGTTIIAYVSILLTISLVYEFA